MPKFQSHLGLTILNPNLKFECKNAKLLSGVLFISTKQNEVLVYMKEENKGTNEVSLKKKYIILSSMQNRQPIIDIFVLKQHTSLLSFDGHVVIVIFEPLVISYHNLDDGLCLKQINLSSFAIFDALLKIHCVSSRFLLIIFSKKAILFDSYTHLVIKEEPFKYIIKQPEQLGSEKVSSSKKEEHLFEIESVFKIKNNSFYLQSKANETFFLNLPRINEIKPISIDYSITRIRIVKQSFKISKWFNPTTSLALYSNEDYLLFQISNSKIIVSFLDSVEELTQLSSYTSKEKQPIIYLNSLTIGNKEYFIAIHTDLICELFSYVKTIREIRLEYCFKLLYEEDQRMTRFITDDNILIGYTKHITTLFNIATHMNNNKEDIGPSLTITLSNLFNAKSEQSLFFTKYFTENFPHYLNEVNRQLMPLYSQDNAISVTASVLFAYAENKSIYYIIGTNTGKISIFDIFFTETFLLNPLIVIDYHKASIISLTIYDNRILIAASSDGMITFTDICSQKIEAAINRNDNKEVEHEDNKKENQIANRSTDYQPKMTFVSQRNDSIELFTKQFNYSFVRKLSLHNKKGRQGTIPKNENELKTIRLAPFKKIKNYSKLSRICKIMQLDTDPDDSFLSKPILGFEIEDNSMLIIKMDTYDIIYRYYNSDSQGSVKGVYHRRSHHALIFYLSHHAVKIASYLTRTADRYISDPDTIYDILNTEEMLGHLFFNKNDITDYVHNISMSSIKYQEPENKPLHQSQSQSQTSPKKTKVTLESIEGYVTNENLKELFITKYYQNLSLNKQTLNTSIYNQDNHSALINNIIQIITDTKEINTNNSHYNEKIKQIEIMNLVYNPQYFINLQHVDNSVCMKRKACTGVLSNLILIGYQYAQFVSFDYERYFNYLENVVKDQENIDNSIFRTNYFNWISLFQIWNFSMDLDTFLYQKFKLVQPIFTFYPILLGENDACSLLLPEDHQFSGDNNNMQQSNSKFSQHFDYFLNYVNTAFTEQKKNESNSILKQSITSLKGDHSKKDFFLNKSALLDHYQGFLVNMINYKLSTNTSHHLHVLLFGSLIALLGYKLNTELCDFIDSEKKIMKILSSKQLIDYCNLEMFHQLMYTDIDDLSLANNGLMLVDYLTLENSLISKINSNAIAIKTNQFQTSLKNLMSYISKVYMFIFDLPNEDQLYPTFAQLNRSLNLDACGKLEFLTEFELSIVSFILNYDTISQENKLPHSITIKAFELLILFTFKIINSEEKSSIKMSYAKIVIELLEKSNELIDEIYKENMAVYSKILIDFYTFSLSPINLEALFKPFSIGTIKMIKSELNHNFLKIILAKLIKLFSKTKLNHLVKLIVEEFKKKHNPMNNDYYTYLIELLWLLMKDRHSKIPQYLPTVANLIMITLSPLNKEFKNQCIDYSKKVLSALMNNYPMISFHSLTQKLVVGATDGKIYIYDIITGNLWKNWVAHDSEVTAVILDSKGAMLLSYSSTDCHVKYWTIGLTNFFRNFFSMKDGYYKQKKLPPILKEISPEEKLSIVKFQFIPKKDNEIVLIRENNVAEIFKL